MKILYVGHLNKKARAYQRYRALCDLGHSVVAYTSVPESRGYYDKPGIADRILWKLGIPRDITKLNKQLIKGLENFRAEIIWIDKGNIIKPRTLKKIKELYPNTKLVSFAEDDMFAPHNHTLFYKKGLKFYDVVFTTKSYNCNKKELPSFGAKKVVFIGNAYDKNVHRPIKLNSEDSSRYNADVGFIGSYEEDRAKSMLFLAENGIKVRVWGGGWDNSPYKHFNLKIENSSLFGDEYIKSICSTKINLGFLRKINRDLQTARSVEIPACKSFMLAERTKEHFALFEEGVEADYFSSNNELLEKIKFYLKNDTVRLDIAKKGYERCLKSGYSHHARLDYMLSLV